MSPVDRKVIVSVHSWRRPSRRLTIILAAVTAVLALAGGGIAYAATQQPAIKTFTPDRPTRSPTSTCCASRSATTTATRWAPASSPADSNYAKEAESVAASGERWLQLPHHKTHGTKAIVLDVDDTTLLTWNYEIFSNWAFNPTTNAQFVTDQRFPAVFGMVDLVNTAEREGYADLLPDRPPGDPGSRDAGQPDRRRHRRRRRLPEADDAERRRGRPVHQAGRGRLPGLPEGGVRQRPERRVHDDPLQVRDARAHRVARIRHRGELRRPVQRPDGRLRRPYVQDAEPELLPAVVAATAPNSAELGPPAAHPLRAARARTVMRLRLWPLGPDVDGVCRPRGALRPQATCNCKDIRSDQPHLREFLF